MKAYKRTTYFIERKYQTKYIILTLTLLLAYTITLVAMVFAPYVSELASGAPLAQRSPAARTLLDLHAHIWPGVVSAMVLFSVLSVYISHQVAGPIYRIRQGVQRILAGDLTEAIHLRRRDDLKDLAECTNQLRDEILHLHAVVRDNQVLLAEYRQVLEEKGEDSRRLQAEMARNREIIEKYRTE